MASDEHDVDLIAMSSHGAGGMTYWPLGGVTERVLQVSRRPLLIVPSYVPSGLVAPPEPIALDHLVVAVDGPPEQAQLSPIATALARREGIVELFQRPDRPGAVGEVLEYVRNRAADVLVIQTRGRVSRRRWTVNCSVCALARRAALPLLVVPVVE